MWKNLINDKQYIGSAVDLSNKLSSYYYTTYMENTLKISRSHIYCALLKNGHANFSITILEYCEPDKCLEREGYYWKLFKPEYNIAKKPGAPMSGRNHSEETKKKIMSEANKGKPRPEGTGKPSQQIEVTDIKNNITTTYISMSEASKALNINETVIGKYFSRNQKKPYKGQYTFNKL